MPTYHSFAHVSSGLDSRTGRHLVAENPAGLIMPDGVNLKDGLSEDEAITIGLQNNPAFQELLADLRIAEANITEASQLRNPQLNTLFPVGAKQWELTLLMPLDVLWLRPIRVAATELESHRVAERLVQDGLNGVRDIRVAYANWYLAVQRLRIARDGEKLRKEVARVAEERLKAGDVAELNVSAIRLDALVSTTETVSALRDEGLAREQLRYLLGMQLSPIKITPAASAPVVNELLQVKQLVAVATQSRPDLLAFALAAAAAEQKSELASRDIWRVVGVVPDLNSQGFKGFEAGPGLRFELPVFHQNQGAIELADAQQNRAERQYINRRDMVALEVRRAHIQLRQAIRDRQIWRERILPQAQAAVKSSQRALQENAVSLLLVLETTRQLLNAQRRGEEADAQVRRSIAELERSVGRSLVNVPQPMNKEVETTPQQPR